MGKLSKIEGQISFWDVEIPKVPEVINVAAAAVIKTVETVKGITREQQSAIDKYNTVQELQRVVNYCGGGVGIELQYNNEFKTVYVNKKGQEEFVTPNQVPAIPLDTIILSKNGYEEMNEIQRRKLQDLKEKHNLKSYIKRYGDKNVIVKIDGKVIAINQQGWQLEFSSVVHLDNEVINFKDEKVEYKVGDVVIAMYGEEQITGTIFTKYTNQDCFNIVWDNRHSAFHISAIKGKVA